MKRRILWVLPVAIAAAIVTTAVVAAGKDDPSLTSVPAQVKAAGYAPANVLSQGLSESIAAQGSTALENPSGPIGWYGYINNAPSPDNPALPQMVPGTTTAPTEAQKTEPDKNTYLVLKNQDGADPGYNYGTHFLFQGHEVGATIAGSTLRQSLITRINLDADSAHRVTLMAAQDAQGNPIQGIDGSTWDPWAKKLLFTTENPSAPTYAMPAAFPGVVTDVSGALGRGGYEGIQDDSDGNIWIVEDVGGSGKNGTTAKRPNSFVYRYVPKHKGDLANGKLQVLQVLNAAGTRSRSSRRPRSTRPIRSRFAPTAAPSTRGGSPSTTPRPTATRRRSTPTRSRRRRTAHRSSVRRTDSSGRTTASRSSTSTRPATRLQRAPRTATRPPAPAVQAAGRRSSSSSQNDPSSDAGKLSLFYEGNESVAGLDNVTFISHDQIAFVEDAGDGLHGQRKALDSGYVFDVTKSYAHGAQPVRFLGEGRDPSATLDSANGGFGKNEGDNEITGIHVSDGNPKPDGVLGTHSPNLSAGDNQWRWFWTQQHGDNFTWEITLVPKHGGGDN